MAGDVAGNRDKTPCVACCEPIHPEARVCPHCGSPQAPRRWQAVGAALKWVGGITAVTSLVFAMVQLEDLPSTWRDRGEAVDELVAAARFQVDTRDYEGAWQLLGQALDLEPGSREARALQAPLAMAWLRHLWFRDVEHRPEVVDRLMPSLYLGVNRPKQTSVADIQAHIGWGNNLKFFDGRPHGQIDTHYARALELDPGNVYAHVFWGIWVLNETNTHAYAESKLAKARRHFTAAFDSVQERDYVTKVTLAALLKSYVDGAQLESVRFADAVRKADVAVSAALKKVVLTRVYERLAPQTSNVELSEETLRRLTAILSPDDLLQTFLWALGDMPANSDPGSEPFHRRYRYQFILARLTEATGDKAKALSLYASLRSDPKLPQWLNSLAAAAMARLGAGGMVE
jgi:hypothetical protein